MFEWKDKTFTRSFLIFYFSILVIIGGLVITIMVHEFQDQKDTRDQQIKASCQGVQDYLEEIAQREYLLALSLQSNNWVNTLNSRQEYIKVFSASQIEEISQSYIFTSILNPDILFRAVYFTKNQSVIHTNGINKASYYFQQKGVPHDEIQTFLDEIGSSDTSRRIVYPTEEEISFSGNILLVNKIMGGSSSKTYLCSMLSVSVLKSQIDDRLSDDVTGFDIYDAANQEYVLQYRSGSFNQKQDQVLSGYHVSLLDWDLTFYENTDYLASSLEQLIWSIVLAFVAILIAVPISMWLAQYVYRMFRNLSRRIPLKGKSDDLYQNIQDNITDMASVWKLSQKEDRLRHLLAGIYPNSSSDQEPSSDTPLGVQPDYHGKYVQVILLTVQDENAQNGLFALLSECQGHLNFDILRDNQNEIVLIASSSFKEELSSMNERLKDTFQAHQPQEGLFFGSQERGNEGVAVSYQDALKKQEYLGFVDTSKSFYLPFPLENQWMSAIREGKVREAEAILKRLLSENTQRLNSGQMKENDLIRLAIILTDDLVRFVMEHHLDESLLSALEEIEYGSIYGIFGKVQEVSTEICALMSAPEEDVYNETANEMIVYIDTHYSDPNLSITQMHEVFGVSANTMNKYLRDAAKTTFLPYLTKVRMEKAKELLRQEGVDVSDVYREVGYDIEYSFQRAFLRYTGMSPKDYSLHARGCGEETGQDLVFRDA